MGAPLISYPDAELREILAALERVAWGEVRTGELARPALIQAIYELDEVLEGARR